MSESTLDRFEELDAGRVLGDLDAQELQEWETLCKSLDAGPEFTLDLAAAAVESEFLMERDESLPSGLAERLHSTTWAQGTPSAASPPADNIVRPSRWRQVLQSTQVAWAAAAVLAILLVANLLANRGTQDDPTIAGRGGNPATGPTQIATEEARNSLAREASDLLKVPFTGLPGYDNVTGELIWSDSKQEGYMTLTNLPPNDATKNQYQLWIVDPSRDDEPVDGGVFDMLPDQKTALVPIRNPLTVSNPVAFLITLEKPGGVVVSDQAVKVALAAPKA